VSEGEQRCLCIAAFFAELSTADDPSGIVFDDPVSSLDYKWREGVARRLAYLYDAA
jgi:wobble nucleotide-excising tRNase